MSEFSGRTYLEHVCCECGAPATQCERGIGPFVGPEAPNSWFCEFHWDEYIASEAALSRRMNMPGSAADWDKLGPVERAILRHMPDEWTPARQLPPLVMASASVDGLRALLDSQLVEFKSQGESQGFAYRRTPAGQSIVPVDTEAEQPHAMTDAEARAFFERASDYLPASRDRIIGMVRIHRSPVDAEDVASLALDMAEALLAQLNSSVAGTDNERLKSLLTALRHNTKGVCDLVHAYDREVQPKP